MVESAGFEPANEKYLVNQQQTHTEFEKELIKIIKMSDYTNVSQIYKNFYEQTSRPEMIERLLKV